MGRTFASHSIGHKHPVTTQVIHNLKKCSFGKERIQYLGYIMDDYVVHVDLANIQAIHDWSTLMTLKELPSFLGLAKFYRKFLLGFSHIDWTLSQMTKGVSMDNFFYEKSQ